MAKFLALIFTVVVFNCISPISEAYDSGYDKKTTVEYDVEAESAYERKEFKDREKYHTKKFQDFEGKKDSYYKEKSTHKDPHWQPNEYDENGKVFVNKKIFEDTPRNEKYRNYGQHQNDFENPSKNKGVNYHDKNVPNVKEKHVHHSELEGAATIEPVSLHHDIDVNYIGSNSLSSDAEFINIEGNLKNHKKKAYLQNANDRGSKKTNFYKNLRETDLTTIPSSNNSALVARFIIHNIDWTAIGTLSTNGKIKGGPFVNIISFSDGTVNKGSGVPFFYMTPKDFSSIDLEKDNRCSISVTLAQTDYCKEKKIDPESPLCARLILVGKIKKIGRGTEEENFARLSLFQRHPEMESWPADHSWFFAKLKIKLIILINHFGGASYINVQDYFNVTNN